MARRNEELWNMLQTHEGRKKLREKYRNNRSIALAVGCSPATVSNYYSGLSVREEQKPATINSRILDLIKKPVSPEEICSRIGISERVLSAAIEDLTDDGFLIQNDGTNLYLCKSVPPKENVVHQDWRGDQIIRFGVVSDTHLCSKWQQLSILRELYDIFEREEIDTVYNSGDIIEGVNMRPGHEYEVFQIGADAQVKYVVEKYPKKTGIKTRFISGNHDHSTIKHAGYDIGASIARQRPDMEYLGMNSARIFLTPNCTMELNHPLTGAAYALSYSCQKTIDSYTGGEKPNILINGHHHKSMYFFYRNIHALEAGTTQAQTPWMKGKRIAAHVGGWIIEAHVDEEGTITRFKPEWIPFYIMKENDWE